MHFAEDQLVSVEILYTQNFFAQKFTANSISFETFAALSSLIIFEGCLLRPLELVFNEQDDEDIDETEPSKIEVAPNTFRKDSFVGSMLSDSK